MNFIHLILIFGIGLAVFHYAYRYFQQRTSRPLAVPTDSSNPRSFSLPKWLQAVSNPFHQRRIKKLQQQRHHKVKTAQATELLTELGVKTEPARKTHFHRLNSLVQAHEQKKIPPRPNFNSATQYLNQMIEPENRPNSVTKLSKSEADQVLRQLRKISKRN